MEDRDTGRETKSETYNDLLKTAQAAVADALEAAPPGSRWELTHAADTLRKAEERADREERWMVRRFPPRGGSPRSMTRRGES